MAKRASSQLTTQGEALRKEGKAWIERVTAAWQREKTWESDAEAAVKAYTNESGGRGKLYDYNIFHSNVETIVPAIINSPPVPDIRRRFGDDDPIAKTVGDIIERAIGVQVDDSRLEVELEGQAQDGFIAGRGVIRLRFHAEAQETETSALKDAEEAVEDDEAPDEDAEEPVGTGYSGECITFEAVSWRDYQHGPAKRWEDRPWESFRHVMETEDLNDFSDRNVVTSQMNSGEEGSKTGDCVVYEIWNKRKREVVFVDEKGLVRKRLPDPLGLTKFFPSSRPVQPIDIVGRLMPVTPFSVYRKLADELDILTKRINVLTAAMKVKGAFAGGIASDLMSWANADDNELVVLTGIEAIAQQGGIDKAVTWWPVDKFAPVIDKLFQNRDLTKQAIYEITGISDIVRGASKASETLGAQQIKSQWGSLRIKKMQNMMERSARDLFVMMSEIIPAKFSLQSLEKMTGIPILPAPTDAPEVIQQKQAVMALLKQPLSMSYRVDVESESTVRADLTMKKQEMSEFLTGAASYFQGMQPIIEQGGPEAAEAVLEIFGAATRNFDLGKSAEDAIDKMIAGARAKAKEAKDNPQPPKPTPDEIKAQIEGAKAQAAGAEAQGKAQVAMKDLELKQQIAAADDRARQAEIASNERIEGAKLEAATAKSKLDNMTKIVVERIATQADTDAASIEAQLARDLGLEDRVHEVRMAAIQHASAKDIQASAPKPVAKSGAKK